MYRLCWSKFTDPQTPIVQQYYQLFLEPTSGNDVPITPQVNVSVRTQSAVATGLQLQVGSTPALSVHHVGMLFLHLASDHFMLSMSPASSLIPTVVLRI